MSAILSKYFKGDKVIWIVITALFLISLLAVYSSTGTLAYRYRSGNTSFYLFRHLKFILFGIFVILVVQRIPYTLYANIYKWFLRGAVVLLFLTLVFGTKTNSAARWLTVPGLGMTFQTSDLAKFALIMYVSRFLALNQNSKAALEAAFKPIMIATFGICGLILPADFSTAFLLFATVWILMFVGRMPMKLLLKTIAWSIAGLAIFIMLAYAFLDDSRIKTWENRIKHFFVEESVSEAGSTSDKYQINQAKIAIATGGIVGKGPGNSDQRNFLPHPYSDFIYAIIIEEYGLIGALIVLFLYLYLLHRAGTIVRKSSRTFPAMLVVGLTLSMVLQAMTNMAVAVELIPVTGQPLPLVSMGGTSILFSSVSLGIILSVSTSNEEQALQLKKEKLAAKEAKAKAAKEKAANAKPVNRSVV